MNFYGQVMYEFTKMFSKIYLKNNINEDFVNNIYNNTEFQASDRWDTLQFEAGNKWLALEGDPINKKIIMYHNQPSNNFDGGVIQGINLYTTPEEGENISATQLQQGNIIQTTSHNIDKAGHITSNASIYFQLPKQQIQLNGEDESVTSDDTSTLRFNSDDWISLARKEGEGEENVIQFSHATQQQNPVQTLEIITIEDEADVPDKEYSTEANEEDAPEEGTQKEKDAILLEYGSYFKVPLLKSDNAGHLGAQKDNEGNNIIEYKYFQMPLTPDQAVTDKLKDVETIKNILTANNANFSALNKGLTKTYKEIHDEVTNLNSNYLKGSWSAITAIDTPTLENTIGIISSTNEKEQSLEKYLTAESEEGYLTKIDYNNFSCNIVDAIKKVYAQSKLNARHIQESNSTLEGHEIALSDVQTRMGVLEVAINGLDSTLKSIESRIKNLEDKTKDM